MRTTPYLSFQLPAGAIFNPMAVFKNLRNLEEMQLANSMRKLRFQTGRNYCGLLVDVFWIFSSSGGTFDEIRYLKRIFKTYW